MHKRQRQAHLGRAVRALRRSFWQQTTLNPALLQPDPNLGLEVLPRLGRSVPGKTARPAVRGAGPASASRRSASPASRHRARNVHGPLSGAAAPAVARPTARGRAGRRRLGRPGKPPWQAGARVCRSVSHQLASPRRCGESWTERERAPGADVPQRIKPRRNQGRNRCGRRGLRNRRAQRPAASAPPRRG